jgi:hypothetical protein
LIFESAIIQIVNKTSEVFVGEICFLCPFKLMEGNSYRSAGKVEPLVFWHAGSAFDTLSFIAVLK